MGPTKDVPARCMLEGDGFVCDSEALEPIYVVVYLDKDREVVAKAPIWACERCRFDSDRRNRYDPRALTRAPENAVSAKVQSERFWKMEAIRESICDTKNRLTEVYADVLTVTDPRDPAFGIQNLRDLMKIAESYAIDECRTAEVADEKKWGTWTKCGPERKDGTDGTD